MRRQLIKDVYTDWLEHAKKLHPHDYKRYEDFIKRYG